MDKYKDIRPYNDDEVRPVIERLIQDDELISTIGIYKFSTALKLFPGIVKTAIRFFLKRQTKRINDVASFQAAIEKYMSYMSESSTEKFTISGLDNLQPDRAYIFMSNHRDISMAPALVDYALLHNKRTTVRIDIGDNLLTKPYVSDLMRLNKSFIVDRSETKPKAMYKALKLLSS